MTQPANDMGIAPLNHAVDVKGTPPTDWSRALESICGTQVYSDQRILFMNRKGEDRLWSLITCPRCLAKRPQ